MIDLNYKKNPEKEEPLSVVVLGTLPFVLMLFWGIVHAL